MSQSLDPLASAREQVLHIPTSLMSAASAHTLKPSIEAPGRMLRARPAQKQSVKVVALAALSAAFGLTGAVGLSHLRARTAPVVQIVSGNPTLKKGSDGESVRWHAKKSKVYFDASLDNAGAHAREAVQLGFGTWVGSGAKLPSLDFDSTKDAKFGQVPNGKSEVMYGPITLAGHENDLALTVTFSDPKTGEVVESDMIFNSNHPYGILPYAGQAMGMQNTASCDQKYDLQSVATHEAGHFFGLGEDFDSKPATMYYTTGRCETNKRALLSSDETTMNALYLVASNNQASDSDNDASGETATAKGCGGARIGQGRTNGSVPALSLLGLLGFVAWRRRRG
ncbi:MAG TPA: matrixin family metalloprotease [Polyangiaceae bacterium]|nr:matrixin family metalloprotease [Polyangiaceae bacterium]